VEAWVVDVDDEWWLDEDLTILIEERRRRIVYDSVDWGGRLLPAKVIRLEKKSYSIRKLFLFIVFFKKTELVRFGYNLPVSSILIKPKLNRTGNFFKYSNQFHWFFFMIWFFLLMFFLFSWFNLFFSFFTHLIEKKKIWRHQYLFLFIIRRLGTFQV